MLDTPFLFVLIAIPTAGSRRCSGSSSGTSSANEADPVEDLGRSLRAPPRQGVATVLNELDFGPAEVTLLLEDRPVS